MIIINVISPIKIKIDVNSPMKMKHFRKKRLSSDI